MAAIVSGCGPSSPRPGASPPSVIEPSSQNAPSAAPYRVDVRFSPDGGAAQSFTLYADGPLRRFERVAASGARFAIVTDSRTGEGFVATEVNGRPLAMTFRSAPPSALDLAETFEAAPPSRARRCRHLQERGRVVRAEGRVACVTADGVLLTVDAKGRREWEVTFLHRGPIDAALFVIPANSETMSAEDIAGTPQAGAP